MNRVCELRQAKNLTRTQLAAASGVTERYIYFIENGERTPSMKTAQSIANALDTRIDDIFLHSNCTTSTLKDNLSQ